VSLFLRSCAGKSDGYLQTFESTSKKSRPLLKLMCSSGTLSRAKKPTPLAVR